jgi:hypothetical protein
MYPGWRGRPKLGGRVARCSGPAGLKWWALAASFALVPHGEAGADGQSPAGPCPFQARDARGCVQWNEASRHSSSGETRRSRLVNLA